MCFQVPFKGIDGVSLTDRDGKFVPGHWTCNGKRAGAYCCVFNSGDAERECVRWGTEGTGWCVQVQLVAEIGRCRFVDTFIGKKVEFEGNALGDRQPVERLKKRSHVVSLLLPENQTSGGVLYPLKATKWRGGETREKRVTIVKTRKDERGYKFYCCING